MYDVELTETAEKQLKKLDKQPQERIIALLERIRINPNPHIKRLVGQQLYRLRAGDYRVILKIDHGKLIILVVEIGRRENIYD